MNNLLTAALALFGVFCIQSQASHAQSPFPSGIPGVGIPNAQYVDTNRRVVRGSEPRSRVSDLSTLGITDVVIFKEDVRGEVAKEEQNLKSMGFTSSQVTEIPMQWSVPEEKIASCTKVLTALKILVQVEASSNRKVFFHCTSGEDRTGMLAGLFRMINQGWTKDKAFKDEMCARGYEAGDPKKNMGVVQKIRQNLTPMFLSLAGQIETGKLTQANLSVDQCSKINFEMPAAALSQYRCGR